MIDLLDPMDLTHYVNHIISHGKRFSPNKRTNAAYKTVISAPYTPSKWQKRFGGHTQGDVINHINDILKYNNFEGHASFIEDHRGGLALAYYWPRDVFGEKMYGARVAGSQVVGAFGNLLKNAFIFLIVFVVIVTVMGWCG